MGRSSANGASPYGEPPRGTPPRVLHVVESWPPVPSGYASRSRWIVATQARTGVARPAVLVTSRQRVYDGHGAAPLDGVPVEIAAPSATERCLRAVRPAGLRRPFHVDGGALARRIEAAARAHRAEIVHVHWASAIGAAAARAARRLGLPLVAELRFDLAGAMFAQGIEGRAGPVGRLAGPFAEPLARRWFDRHLGAADAIVVASDALGAFVADRLPSRVRDVVSVPNGIDAAFLAACDAARRAARDGAGSGAAARAGATVVGTTSKMLRYEGLDALIEAARELPGIDLLFVGDGPERERLERLARPLNGARAERVRFAGRVPGHEIPAWLARIDVFAVPRRDLSITRHASPIKVVEAMAAARCTVAAAVGDVRSLLDGGCGLLVPPDDPRALVDALRRASDDAALRGRLGEAARARVADGYRGDELVDRYRAVYARALARRADVAGSGRRRHAP